MEHRSGSRFGIPGIPPDHTVTLFFCGDVMTGRGIDQVLPHPASPELYEDYVRNARDYVDLATAAHGEIPAPVGFDYIWGDALGELARFRPSVRLINLETSITRHSVPWPGKAIHYRMHPGNARCLQPAGIDFCALANNHVLDWGHEGLRETCRVLDRMGIAHAGAGANELSASRPACVQPGPGARVLIWSIGLADSGIPREWAARDEQAGVWRAGNAREGAEALVQQIGSEKRPGDLAVVSVHWGSNWGYRIPREHTILARRLIDAGADLIHGHSSHHIRGMELYRGRPILYGCGDFINDYEGLRGYESFRPDLALMYFCRLAPADGRLLRFWMTPMRRERFALHRANEEASRWLEDVLNRERRGDAPPFTRDEEGRLQWVRDAVARQG
ncbi:Capsule biosynthesis protein capA [Thioalkalivibrio nitratireducens DSM 14787]|uniref:Capsule biosynthesis protein capA n=1 Tax=Thioalkalivibrio nitratireducens (strain DSM 14787 / UNIQEM 213 / ALEN2) TaxID=1255043 RepID=L0E075_THIND|nr:CapA family protein [Thioalkalivibrio nitratireducens]AGA34698.1 Capsule biosynthesis protein capA [Thioalkalivibrio nitratireducens DSM 14787]